MGLTLANVLTILRMAVIPFFIVAVGYNRHAWAFYLFIAAGLTDLLDGVLARRWQQQTSIGAILDPMADKLLLTAAFVMLAMPEGPKAFPALSLLNRIPIYVVIITISRDVFISLIALVMYMTIGRTKFPPSFPGKLTTATQVTTVGVLLLGNYLNIDLVIVGPMLIWCSLAMTLISGFHYLYLASRMANADAPR